MKTEENNLEDFNLRSEEVQEVLGNIPPWILRYGIVALCVTFFALLSCSYFIKYPDVVSANIVITSTSPQINIVARQSGKLSRLSVRTGQHVVTGQVIGVIDNATSYNDVNIIKDIILRYRDYSIPLDSIYGQLSKRVLTLGRLQNSYSALMSSLATYMSLDSVFHVQMQKYRTQHVDALNTINRQEELLLQKKREEMRLSHSKLDRELKLKDKDLVSQEAYEIEKQRALQVEQGYLLNQIEEQRTRIQISQLQQDIIKTDREFLNQKEENFIRCHLALSELWAGIKGWEEEYVLYTPSSGIVDLIEYWSVNTNVNAGDVVCSVSPTDKGEVYARAELPADRSGKVAVGQRVIIRLQNYPEQEFGILDGTVRSISKSSSQSAAYVLEIALPKGLVTNYGKSLSYGSSLVGTVDIVTQELRLIERLLFPIKKIMRQI